MRGRLPPQEMVRPERPASAGGKGGTLRAGAGPPSPRGALPGSRAVTGGEGGCRAPPAMPERAWHRSLKNPKKKISSH